MGGREAARGFEYQFLCTLEHALDALLDPTFELATVSIERPPDPGADREIVDFALHDRQRCVLAVQVKSGVAGNAMSASQAVQMLLRLLTQPAERYAVITSRGAGPSLTALIDVLRRHRERSAETVMVQQEVVALVAGADDTHRAVLRQDEQWWERLRHAEIILDHRSVDEVYAAVRERVRAARHQLDPAHVGWDAAGLLTHYLVAEVLAKAAARDAPDLSRTDLATAVCQQPENLQAVMLRRDWAVHVTPAPRGTDIARPALLGQIADALPTPITSDTPAVCVLAGLSGIGKTSLAAAWADDRADAYAAILWIDATSAGQVEASFAAVASWYRSRGVIADSGVNVRHDVFVALAHTARPWLMVFDNCSDVSQIRDWIPPRGYGHVIVTTTDQTSMSGPGVTRVPVTEMTEPEATTLLTRRVSHDQPLTEAQQDALRQLAHRLHSWPLALELAASYLRDCLDGVAGIAEYERLVMRSLADVSGVPPGYPDTLVNAISLAWQRMSQRPGDANQLACLSLQFAAFITSRQIPIHLLLACCLVNPQHLMQLDTKQGIFRYALDDPPPGEITRAMKRQSLVATDEPLLPLPDDDPGTPRSLGYTIAMNDIVQAILRQEIDRDGNAPAVLSAIAFHTQYWITFFSDRKDMHHACAMVGHAVAAAEHALRMGAADKNIALLWGNTAGLLGYLDYWAGAVRYLRAELAYLDHAPHPRPLMRTQTLVALAGALFNEADRPRDVQDEIISLLERFLCDLPEICDTAEEIAAHTVRAALATALNLSNNGVSHRRLTPVQSALTDYCDILPMAGAIDFQKELSRMTTLLRTGADVDARDLATRLLPHLVATSVELPHILRVLVEANAGLGEWTAAQRIADDVVAAAKARRLRRFDSATFARNVAGACFEGLVNQEQPAMRLFRTALSVADLADQYGTRVQAGDRDIIAVYRAVRACLDHDRTACRDWLRQVNLDDIKAVEPVGISKALYHLLSRWITLSAQDSEQADRYKTSLPVMDSSRTNGGIDDPLSAQVPMASLDVISRRLDETEIANVPLVAAALTQVFHAANTPLRDPCEVTQELCSALCILGFKADVVETVFMVRKAAPGALTTIEPTWFTPVDAVNLYTARAPHYIVWSETFNRCVDPTIAHLPAFHPLTSTGEMAHGPVVIPLDIRAAEGTPDAIAVIPRAPFQLSYQLPRRLDAATRRTVLSAATQRVCDTNAFLLALRTALTLSARGSTTAAELAALYPHLGDLLTPLP